ncbi:MAG TPA: DUF2341 domain-containing protein [archaeon]|nr:DUF2341 domain-containing protein [archaeon]HPV66514.1 DUF2341 domain-containing protein [archaeon]
MNSKGANVIFTSIMIILLSVTAMIIIIGFVLPFFTSLREEMKFNQNKENLILINKEFAELKTNDIDTFKNLNLDVVDEIVFDEKTNAVYIKQKISSNTFKNFKDSNIGNLSIIKANGLMTFTLYLDGVVTLEKTVVVNGNYPLRLTIIDIVNNIPVVSITPYLGQVYFTINPKISTFIGELNITINATPEDANIYYTLDGSEPTESSIPYTRPFTITDSATIKTRGYANGYAESAITSRKYIKLIQIIYRKKITIDHKKVDDNLTDFPVLISIRDENLVSLAKEDGSDIYFTSSDGTTRLKREIESFTDINLFRKKITINHTKVESTLTNFPILIKLTDVNLTSFAQSDGSDIYFTLSDGTTRLKREIEDYNSETGTLVAWVKIPELSSTADTNFYMYFGDKTESNSNDKDVWNSDYNAVYHMNDKTNSTMLDSTAFENDVTKKGANEPNQIIGKIGYAQDFDGTDDYAVMKNAVEVVSVSFWINGIEGISGADYIIGGQGSGDGGFRYLDNDSSWLMYYGTGYKSLVWNHGGNETGWHLINIERSITDIRDFNVYVDGENIGITTANTTTPAKIYFNQIGRRYMLYNLDGVLDEIQYRNKNKSAEWIKTEYNNQSSPETFYNIGNLEELQDY